jgi:Cu(I)/Ag(I) efflux system protein CusF
MNRMSAVLAMALMSPLTTAADDAHHKGSANVAQAAVALSEGEVRKIDKEAKKLTIRHGPLANLDMPPMTMVFQVTDPAMLERVKVGDKIRFQADKVGGAYTVTRMEAAK